MGKIMALDVGSKTIGVAFCEEGTQIAFPGKTLLRHEGRRRDMAALRELIALNDVRRIVVGMPLFLDGTRGVQAKKVDAFIAILRNSVRIPIITQDEGLSTSESADLLLSAGKRPAQHKETIDSVAAALILEWYLASEQGKISEGEKRRRGEEEKENADTPCEPQATGHELQIMDYAQRPTKTVANG